MPSYWIFKGKANPTEWIKKTPGLKNEVNTFSQFSDSLMEILLCDVNGVLEIYISLFVSVTDVLNILLLSYSFFVQNQCSFTPCVSLAAASLLTKEKIYSVLTN